MRFLVLSFYYKPDLCAGSFRSSALVEAMMQYENCEIEVISTLPNRYATFTVDAKHHEKNKNVTIHRIALPSHKSGMFDQIRSFISFYRETSKIVKNSDFDCVFATSSRLFTAFMGARIAKKKKVPLYLDIRDIFVDTIKDVLPSKVVFLIQPVLSFIERYTINRAHRINLVSKGFEEYFSTRYPNAKYRWFTNGIDKEFLLTQQQYCYSFVNSNPIKVLYAGNIGEGQGLHNILPDLATSLMHRIEFIIIGDGGRKAQLLKSIASNEVGNVRFLDPLSRDELIKWYQKADILFLHLNDYPAFEKVLPSKIFEYAAMGKPIWAGVSGFAAKFLVEQVNNVAVFEPRNTLQAIRGLESLEMKFTSRKEFITKYDRANIMALMAKDLYEFAAAGAKA